MRRCPPGGRPPGGFFRVPVLKLFKAKWKGQLFTVARWMRSYRVEVWNMSLLIKKEGFAVEESGFWFSGVGLCIRLNCHWTVHRQFHILQYADSKMKLNFHFKQECQHLRIETFPLKVLQCFLFFCRMSKEEFTSIMVQQVSPPGSTLDTRWESWR